MILFRCNWRFEDVKDYVKLIRLRNFKNIATLVGGNFAAQIITFGGGLILARLYTPADFGILGVFLAISNIITPLSCGGLEASIVNSKSLKDAFGLSFLSIIVCGIISFFLYVITFFLKDKIIQILNCPQIYPWIYLLPISVFLGGVFNVLNYFNIKLKEYKIISISNVIKSSTCALIQIIGGFFKAGFGMLIIGQSAINLFGNLKLFNNLRKYKTQLNVRWLAHLVSENRRYPLFYSGGILANMISLNITNIFVQKLFNAANVGFYSFAYKYISFPLSLIASSIGQVFYQELCESREKDLNTLQVFKETVFKLLIIGIPIFTTLFFVLRPAFIFLFGPQWASAGDIAMTLTPLFFIRFIVSPLSMVLLTFDKQRIILYCQILLLCMTVLPFVLSLVYEISFYQYVLTLVIFQSFGYIIYLITIIYNIIHPT